MSLNSPPIPGSSDSAGESAVRGIGVPQHLAYVVSCAVVLLILYSLLRLALLAYNIGQIGDASMAQLAEAFYNGLRFDLRVVVYACLPLLFALLSPRLMASRRWMMHWLVAYASFTMFLGIVELDFYREFNQRLNGLVFEYFREDPKTVLSMIWFGFPVVRYLLAWAAATWLLLQVFRWLDRFTSVPRLGGDNRFFAAWTGRIPVLLLCLALAAVVARGTLRQGPPLRWGDAFTTDSMFVNQLGLNGTLSLASAAMAYFSSQREYVWKAAIPPAAATEIVRKMLLTASDTLVDEQRAAVRRNSVPSAAKTLPIRHVVFILMESFAGLHVGALGAPGKITPHFDQLAEEGVLFTRFFSNGTHTHQGMFASFACFPNLPGFEFLMKQQESRNEFSGLPQLLATRNYDNLYVYNGDFAWDNQSGFFGKQGVSNFIGRFDFVNPVVFDPTWGVSDQDMFDRAIEELGKKSGDRPFYAMLQTLSNHTPYALPKQLPVEEVSGFGGYLDPHLTAMRYSDWALGQFFEKARKLPFFKEALFVIVGDHGFPTGQQLTEVNLSRFNVPLLLIAPGIREKFGSRRDTVGTQVDIVPTVMGLLGGATRHQCWGRNLLDLPREDQGFGIVKPSGSDQTIALLSGDRVLVESKSMEPRLYNYQLGAMPRVSPVDDAATVQEMKAKLEAYIQTATQSLLDNSAGVAESRH